MSQANNAFVHRVVGKPEQEQPFPARFFDCMTSYKQGAALKAAIELNLFTVLSEGSQTLESLALRLQASVRGVRILCDYLTIEGFLLKGDGRYSATPDAAMFLNRKSPAFMGSSAFFLGDPMLMENFRDLTKRRNRECRWHSDTGASDMGRVCTIYGTHGRYGRRVDSTITQRRYYA